MSFETPSQPESVEPNIFEVAKLMAEEKGYYLQTLSGHDENEQEYRFKLHKPLVSEAEGNKTDITQREAIDFVTELNERSNNDSQLITVETNPHIKNFILVRRP